ncbi:MAG: prepilin-type N-terminal cleavage/methylation domain-containing protein [Planctomycetota bacterium]|nr:prepilin-type N-terminal cleavage/methylation domain-containing protein [Planctomycetota bacterium]MDA1105040.1 prepilin-type N-terminal cleavage/methylation domain-containing protein [Planctomycetota bacterium]
MTLHRARRARLAAGSQGRGFTLLELVVVMGIILILIGLVLAVSGSLTASAEKRALEQAFSILDAAVQEWQVEMGREMTFRRTQVVTGFTTDPITLDHDSNPNTPLITLGWDVQEVPTAQADTQSRTFLDVIAYTERPREILANLPAKVLVKMPGTTATQSELIDPWGKPIRVVFPCRKWGEGTGPDTAAADADGTVRSAQETLLGSCLDRRIRFLSAGPDGVFGDITQPTSSTLYKLSEDNIESYPTR